MKQIRQISGTLTSVFSELPPIILYIISVVNIFFSTNIKLTTLSEVS